ncbi:MAG TPA: LptA/OstA family protein [Candidatus Binataceae bacterium]|nr:LptA/OstA family protein [Candidatus Binataceae bacterium]
MAAATPPAAAAPPPVEAAASATRPPPSLVPVTAEAATVPERPADSAVEHADSKPTQLASKGPTEGAFGFSSSNGPIHVKGDTMEFDDKNKFAVFSGHVHANQAGGELTSDTLRVMFGENLHDVTELFADGNVRISQGENYETSDHARLNQTKRIVVLTGSPVVHSGEDQITGSKITVYLDTGKSVVENAVAVVFPHSSQTPNNGAVGTRNP